MSGARTIKSIGLALVGAMTAMMAQPALAQSGNQNAQPKCSFMAHATPSQWIIQHDPLSDGTATGRFSVSVTNTGSGNCTIKIGAGLRGEAFGLRHDTDSQILPYNLISESPYDNITPRTGRNPNHTETSAKSIKAGQTVQLAFQLEVPVSGVLSSGLYSQQMWLQAIHPGGTERDEVPVVLGIEVRSGALMGLRGAVRRIGGIPTIEIGTLSEGDRRLNTTFYVISTSNYSVSVSSQNGGKLMQGSSEWFVPYSLQVGPHAFDLSAERNWMNSTPGAREDLYPLAVNIGSLANRRAGTYSDVIRFTLAAL